MRASSKLYGVLRADQSKDVTRESKHDITTVIVVPSLRGDDSSIELETWMDEYGNYQVLRRDETGGKHMFALGNIYDKPENL